MDKAYDHKKYEEQIYKLWEDSGAFKPSEKGEKYTILMPPPNANASLHAGHAMYTVDDILIRWKRMQGYAALWQPGRDHAGFETQFVYEKNLAKQGKSRMDFDRETLYNDIYKFVEENSGLIFEQFKRLGFSADWDRSVFTLDPHVIEQVYATFKQMEAEGKVYRDDYIVNYCVYDGTSLAELEVKHVEQTTPLYYIKYGPFTLATVRPETKFGDTAVAVHPDDERYQQYIGQEIEVDGLNGKFKLKVIADEAVDPEFGTGVVKVTPAHDPNDFAMWQRHKDEMPEPKPAIDFRGRMTDLAGKYAGMKVAEARIKVAEDLQAKGLMEKVDENYTHSVITCYKCGRVLEPLIVPNWFIKVGELKAEVKKAVEQDDVRFIPKRFKRHMLTWLDIMHDWPISRQIVWGIRIPVWYSVTDNPNIIITMLDNDGNVLSAHVTELLKDYDLATIKERLQKLTAPVNAKYIVSAEPPGDEYLQETDTFDTWFSSGQWPLVTNVDLPTNVLGTYSDILKFWVSRMIMFSLYLKKEIPFKDVYLWSMVADKHGVKMSKSKGNVINPLDLVEKYGADALRMSLMYGIPAGSKIILSEEKVRGMRNFANKIWNASRYISMMESDGQSKEHDEEFLSEVNNIAKQVTDYLREYKLDKAAELVYEKFWHWYCDICIEQSKQGEISLQALEEGLRTFLKLLHPFMPFVTEAIWSQELKLDKDLLINAEWPQ